MSKRRSFLWVLVTIACCWTACKNGVISAGQGSLDQEDEIVVLIDTFSLTSAIDSCDAIVSQADSFLLGEIETDYGSLKACILTQLACPEGYRYPSDFHIDSIDSICLYMYYNSWTGDASSPMAINIYRMDRKTFRYSSSYATDLDVSDYCSKEDSTAVLINHRIVVASEKLDSIMDENGDYIPMLRMRLNDDFKNYFGAITSFESQEQFNQQFKGFLIESSFGSSTMLNVSDIALGIFYRLGYKKAGRDTVVHDMKAFYANSEVRTVNQLTYADKKELIESLQQDSDTYNYIISPAGAYTRVSFPLGQITDSIMKNMVKVVNNDTLYRRPYVNKAAVRFEVTNAYTGSESQKTRNDWLQPANYMLLIKEESMERFFAKKELPSDTCALLSALVQGRDSVGDAIYYYSFDMSDFITNQLRKFDTDLSGQSIEKELSMLLVPVSVNSGTSSYSSYSSVKQLQSMSATRIRSAKNGLQFEVVYSGFTLPSYTYEE